jgi:hypothetical protein
LATNHKVVEGEHISKIALKYHFSDYNIIWDHGNNADLKTRRPNPNVLNPGDTVFVPDKTPKTETRATALTHTFKIEIPKLEVWIQILDFDGAPANALPSNIKVESDEASLNCGPTGLLRKPILRNDENGHLTVESLRIDVPFKIGHLDPVDEPTGCQARLNNLGYNAGPVGNPEPLQFRSAVEEFQCDNDLPVTGECDDATKAKLLELHNS